MNAIECSNLTRQFGDFKVVNGVSLSVKKGEIFGFFGTNDAGKTTAVRIFCGPSYPTSGQARVAGLDVCTQQERIGEHISYVSQKFSLYDNLTVKENTTFYGSVYDAPRNKIKTRNADFITKLGLEVKANKLVGSLPLGWKQKLTFSVAIFHHPEIVFPNKPIGEADPITRCQFWDIICDASAQGVTVFVTTHYMNKAEYCHHISIMVDGKAGAMDTPTNLKNQFHANSMDEVLYQLARKARRSTD